MQGFKSFAKRTEVVFDRGINVVVGPNGSGKSNVSDALCFVLGRLSIKSMRAAKAKNLLFMGSKYAKPVREANVELVFDNKDKTFNIEAEEVSLQRIVRINGASIYKINGDTKTRLEVIETLAQAGIDPYGFNLVLQGQIQSIIRMHPEDRRKIIEEVAGIAIYESRKEKSLKELEKTDERLKEINSVLREKGAFLRNLEKERSQAMKFKDLELNVRRAKATILSKKIDENKKELNSIEESVLENTKKKDKKKSEGHELQNEIEKLGEKASGISKYVQQASGVEQESLRAHVANLKVEIEGLKVRIEGYDNKRNESLKRVGELQKSIPEMEKEINGLKSESPLVAQKAQELKIKKDELELIEGERRKSQQLRSDLNSIRERIKEKERSIARFGAESEHIIKQLEDYGRVISYKNEEECSQNINNFKNKIKEARSELENITRDMLVHEKRISVSESEISKAEKVKGDVSSIDTCPLCRSKITADHITHVAEEQERTMISGRKIINESSEILKDLGNRRRSLYMDLQQDESALNKSEIELYKHKAMNEKQEQLKKIIEEEKNARSEMQQFEAKRKSMEEKSDNLSSLEEKYHSKILEIEEISSRTMKDVDTSLLYKSRDLERIKAIIKQTNFDIESLSVEVKEMSSNLSKKQVMLNEREGQEKELQAKFKKLFEEREQLQKQIQEKSVESNEANNGVRAIEDQINFLNIGRARIEASKESLEMEMTDYSGIELIQGSLNAVEERLQKSQEALQMIGSINMRALEVYDELKREFDSVQEKVLILEREKGDIMGIVAEIDAKKKRTFMRTFKAMSDLFSENFSRLYTKGVAFLEMENNEDIFSGGVNIVVRLAKGKYFDVTSLSGGEQTLVALSLLFAIQEYKPYHFYVFDEIDAALDKRNSERLAGLLSQYMKSGQYIVITHNDAIIMNANLLYGVSMHDGVSKILSLNLRESLKTAHEIQAQEAQKEAEDAKGKLEEIKEIINESENDKMAHDIVGTEIVVEETKDVKIK